MSGTPTASVACAECGAELPAAAKFCLECGTPVSPAPDRQTRRTVTLLFTDVTGSTAMGEQLDPEAYRDVMGRYFAVARAAVERHGGTVEKFVGDAVLAVFGIPELHEDDALRAVRAAHELNSSLSELSDALMVELDLRLVIRTGVNTGAVVTGSARAGGSFATGDAVNTAARLEQAAAPGEILLGATTYALVRDAVEVEAVEPVLAKGKLEPVSAYRLVRVLDTVHGRRRRDDVALVGRVQESRALDDAFAQTTTSGRSHLVTVLGPPGIGKSRLVAEFLDRISGRADVAQGRCVSYGQGIAYWPLVQALRSVVGLTGAESDEATQRALAHALRQGAERDSVIGVLMPLLGKAGTPPAKEQTFWAVRRLVEELATLRPLVLSLDDLHWAEPTLLDLLERLREEVNDLPLLLLCQARPELLEQHPTWGSGPLDMMTFRLDPLDPAESGDAVAGLLGGEVPAGLADRVASWAGGNPLFVEEIVAHLVESGILGREPGGGWQVIGELAQAQLPPSVSALLASRLDRLPAAERDLLERVSVIGLEFTTADVELLVDPSSRSEIAGLLLALTRRDLVRRVRSTPDHPWAFKHILVRDAAYDALAKARRADLHARFADGVAARAEGEEEYLGFVAHHLEQAARCRRELAARGPQVDALVDRAAEALVLAAEQARNSDRLEDQRDYLKRAMLLEPGAPAVRQRILTGLMDYYVGAEQAEPLGEVLDLFETELRDSADELDRAFLRTMRGVHDIMRGQAIDPGEVAATARELVSLGRTARDAPAVVRGLRVISLCSETLGLWADARASSEEIIRIGSPADARGARSGEYDVLLWGEGTFRECREFLRRDVELYGRSDTQDWIELATDSLVAAADGSPEADSLIAAAVARAEELYAAGKISGPTGGLLIEAFQLNRDLDGATAYAQRVNDEFRRSGAFAMLSTYTLLQAIFMLERGDPSDVVLPLVEEAASHTSPYDAASVSDLAACRAILAVRCGDLDRADELADEALTAVDRTQELWHQADMRRWLSVVPRATGDRENERRLLQQALAMYTRKEIRSYDAEIEARLAELDGNGSHS